MKPNERQFFLSVLRPFLRQGDRLEEIGTAVVFTRVDESVPFFETNQWYIDCPSALGSTGRRQIGRFEQAEGFKDGILSWKSKSSRFLGKGWESRLLREFLAVTGLGKRTPIPWDYHKVATKCAHCGVATTKTEFGPAANEDDLSAIGAST